MLKHYGELLLRTPLQSIEAVNCIGVNEPTAFSDGIYLSSWDLFKELQRRNELKEKEKKRIDFAYSKYWIRSCTRCTPYATFAGFSLVDISSQPTALTLENHDQQTLKLRVDVDFVTILAKELTLSSIIQPQITFHINNSLYELPTGYRYAEYRLENGQRKYELTSLQKSPYLKEILALAVNGVNIKVLQELLLSDEDVSREDADEFINELINSQLLISDLEPTVTGEEPFEQLIIKLSQLSGVEETLNVLLKIRQLLHAPQKNASLFEEINMLMRQLVNSGVNNSLVQADMLLQLRENKINEEVVNELADQLQDLFLLSRPADHPEMENFKNAFIAKYDDAEMPLSLVLDAESGIGYGDFNEETSANNFLINDLTFENKAASHRTEFDDIQQLAFHKYHDYISNQNPDIQIDKKDLTAMKRRTEKYKFSKSIYALGSLMKSGGVFDKNHFLFDVAAFGGTSAANLYGKFTHASEALTSLSTRILEKEEEEYADAIYAEIVHLPEAQVGNILLRPVLRAYEIPYVGRSGVDQAHQITLNDLYVSIRQGEVILMSKVLGKRIIPKLTTAHNYNYKGLPVYKFLCSLQSQLNAKVNIWDWGNLDSLRYLPRVVYKNLLLKKATWKFTIQDIADLQGKEDEMLNYFSGFRDKWALPLRVSYIEEDNKLLIDFSQDHGIKLFIHYLKKLKRMIVEEYVFTPENCLVRDLDGKGYTNEIIIPFYEEKLKETTSLAKVRPLKEGLKKKFLPGSEWSYFKIYAGLKVSEELLKNEILHFIEKASADKLFEKFFVIRFKDEFAHLRLRFYNEDPIRQNELSRAFLEICQPLIDNNYIYKLTMETYVRETDRYGEDLIELSEDIFYNDSLAVLRMLSLIDGPGIDFFRMVFVLRGIDFLLDDFHFSDPEKEQFAGYLQAMFFKEFGGGERLRDQLNSKYRNHKQLIFSYMDKINDEENEIADAIQIFTMRSAMNRSVVSQILAVVHPQHDRQRLNELLASYVHMFANRMFIGQQRMNELVIYHFLERYYLSKSVISKKRSISTSTIDLSNLTRSQINERV